MNLNTRLAIWFCLMSSILGFSLSAVALYNLSTHRELPTPLTVAQTRSETPSNPVQQTKNPDTRTA